MVSYAHDPGTSLQIGSGIVSLGLGLSVNDTVGAGAGADEEEDADAAIVVKNEEGLVRIFVARSVVENALL